MRQATETETCVWEKMGKWYEVSFLSSGVWRNQRRKTCQPILLWKTNLKTIENQTETKGQRGSWTLTETAERKPDDSSPLWMNSKIKKNEPNEQIKTLKHEGFCAVFETKHNNQNQEQPRTRKLSLCSSINVLEKLCTKQSSKPNKGINHILIQYFSVDWP